MLGNGVTAMQFSGKTNAQLVRTNLINDPQKKQNIFVFNILILYKLICLSASPSQPAVLNNFLSMDEF